MTVIFKDQAFYDEYIGLDDRDYRGCTFHRCTFCYRAEGEVRMERCTFSGCNFMLDGPAKAVVEFLTVLHQMKNGGDLLVESFFALVRSGEVLNPQSFQVASSDGSRTLN
jgi:hypothetical protein